MLRDDAIEKNINNVEHVDFFWGSVRYDNLVVLYLI